jgi:hypothetical protein
VLWLYHSDVDYEADTNSGLIGPIIITAAGMETSSSGNQLNELMNININTFEQT